jgi:hypothetical protein
MKWYFINQAHWAEASSSQQPATTRSSIPPLAPATFLRAQDGAFRTPLVNATTPDIFAENSAKTQFSASFTVPRLADSETAGLSQSHASDPTRGQPAGPVPAFLSTAVAADPGDEALQMQLRQTGQVTADYLNFFSLVRAMAVVCVHRRIV